MKVEFLFASETEELKGILYLQKENLGANLTQDEADKEGFVTVVHDLELLKRIGGPYKHVIATAEGKVVGYALAMHRDYGTTIQLLESMFEKINSCDYKGTKLAEAAYLIMGQICIAKGFRKQGLFRRLYKQLIEQVKKENDYLITEVALKNTRSIAAHENCGFESIHIYKDGIDWSILLREI